MVRRVFFLLARMKTAAVAAVAATTTIKFKQEREIQWKCQHKSKTKLCVTKDLQNGILSMSFELKHH